MLTIANYNIIERLYKSSKTLVYRATRTSDAKKVILKLLRPESATSESCKRFKHEHEITSQLCGEGIVSVYTLEEYENSLMVEMSDSEGEALSDILKRQSLKLEEFLSIAIKLAETLEIIHNNIIIQKDINPYNILWNRETSEVKIIDLSISTKLSHENIALQNPNLIEGTLPYISPEQTGRMNRIVDCRTDFYSPGVTFYEILTGQLPFTSDVPMELVHCHIAKRPASSHLSDACIPVVISEIVMKHLPHTVKETTEEVPAQEVAPTEMVFPPPIECLNNFMRYMRNKVFLIIVGDTAHKAKAVSEYIKNLQRKLEIYLLYRLMHQILIMMNFFWNQMRIYKFRQS